ncbi:MAG: hypothetical protein M3N14_03230 [Bacteroidota bacterium]|nr:hypothetical protein [Bacteroidota bacterium]
MKQRFRWVFLAIVLVMGCSTPKEFVMPFINFTYSGERLFPVAKSDADFSFRAWVNFSTSIDRVFTVSHDTFFNYSGKFLEIRGRALNQKLKDKTTFKEINITPHSGFEKFIVRVDSLNLLEMTDQKDSDFMHPFDLPFSIYVIEITSHGKTNQFRFFTNFPRKEKVDDKYQKIQELIFEEFPVKFYFKYR